jgi:exonuclease III
VVTARPCSRQSRPERRPQATATQQSRSAADTNEIDEPYFGDIPGQEKSGRFRVGCVNVNNLAPFKQGLGPKIYSTEAKDQGICKTVKDLHIDILLMQELGVNWAKVSSENQWKARAGVYLDPSHTRSYMSHNTHSIQVSPLQAGGTGIMSYGRMAHIGAGAGSDKAKLGRWTWARYQGKNNSFLRCVSLYRPGKGQGEETVASQHKQYFQSINDDRDPRSAFLEDFEQELQEWLALGDNVIIGGDLNKEVTSPIISELFERNGLVNTIHEKHDLSQAPATFMHGSTVIDGIWATPGIQVHKCGYFAPGDVAVGDHSFLWMDVSYESALGHKPSLPQTFQARRLRLYDSKTTTKYLDTYQSILHEQRVIPRQIRLQKTIRLGVPLLPIQAREADAIDSIKTKAMLRAEKKCRKLKMGG